MVEVGRLPSGRVMVYGGHHASLPVGPHGGYAAGQLYSPEEWAVFVAAVKAGKYDLAVSPSAAPPQHARAASG